MARQDLNTIRSALNSTGFVAYLEQYVAEYLTNQFNKLVADLDAETIKIQGAINSMSGSGATGLMLQPTDRTVDPTTRNDKTALQSNDWYINTKEAAMKWYNKKDDDWYVISLQPMFDAVLQAWKTNVGDNSYVNKDEYISLEEIFKAALTNEETLAVANKWLDGINLRTLFQEIQSIEERNLVDVTDTITYVAADRLEYTDKANKLRTGFPEVVKVGNIITYTTILHPYARLHQIGSSFTGKFEKANTQVQYSLSGSAYGDPAKSIALNFKDKGAATRSTFSLTSINKVENDKIVHYIRITGTAILEIKEAVLPGQTANVLETIDLETDVKDIKADELFPNGQDNAIVMFTFTASPSIGDKVLELEFDAPSQFVVNRYVTEMEKIQGNIVQSAKDQDDKIKLIKNEFPVWNLGKHADAFGSAMYNYSTSGFVKDLVGAKGTNVGGKFLWEVPVEASLAGKGTIMLTKDGAVMEIVTTTDVADADINTITPGTAVVGKDIAGVVEKYYLILEKRLDNANKVYWKWLGLKAKPADPTGTKIITKAYGSWAELEADKDDIISVGLYPKAQIDWYGAAIRQSAFIPLHPFFSQNWGLQGAVDMSNNKEYKVTADAAGLKLFDGTAQVGSGAAGIIGWDKVTIYAQVLVGNTYTTTDTMLENLAKGKANGQYVIQVTDGVPTLVAK